jgi:membrane protein DedA with SNARE-associated domain
MNLLYIIAGGIAACFIICIIIYSLGYWWTKGGLRAKKDFVDDICQNNQFKKE